MCFATAALVAGGLGAATTAVGTVEGGQATANAANYSAAVANNNAIIANQNAEYAIAAGQQKAATESLKNAATMGKIKTGQAASGIDVNTGSAAKVQESAREVGNFNTANVLNNAELTAYGYRSQATSFTAQAQLDTLEAEQAPIGADLSAVGTGLSGISAVGGKFAQQYAQAAQLSPTVVTGP
jgi:hypothetical protein